MPNQNDQPQPVPTKGPFNFFIMPDNVQSWAATPRKIQLRLTHKQGCDLVDKLLANIRESIDWPPAPTDPDEGTDIPDPLAAVLYDHVEAIRNANEAFKRLHHHFQTQQVTRRDAVDALMRIGFSEPQAQIFYSRHKRVLNCEHLEDAVIGFIRRPVVKNQPKTKAK